MNEIYFKLKEFECKCGCKVDKTWLSRKMGEVIGVLVEVRKHFGKPVIINSGFRCSSHNARVGGAANSRHIKGDAVDFVVKGVETEQVYKFVLSRWGEHPYGIATKRNKTNPFGGFVHIDTRGRKSRWEYA